MIRENEYPLWLRELTEYSERLHVCITSVALSFMGWELEWVGWVVVLSNAFEAHFFNSMKPHSYKYCINEVMKCQVLLDQRYWIRILRYV